MDKKSPTSFISQEATLAKDAAISPGTIINGKCIVGSGCRIDTGVILESGVDSIITLEENVHIQAGAIITGNLTISRNALIHAGSIVTRDVPPHAIVTGNPAKIVGYTGKNESPVPSQRQAPNKPSIVKTNVNGVTLHRLPKVLDLRGNLTVGEFEKSIPFDAKRYFMVFGVPNAEVRGEHAHRTCHQFLICAHGQISVVADDGINREEFLLNDPSIGLHLPPLTWGIQYKYSNDAVLLVFASEYYDSEEYIRDYSEFMQLSIKGR